MALRDAARFAGTAPGLARARTFLAAPGRRRVVAPEADRVLPMLAGLASDAVAEHSGAARPLWVVLPDDATARTVADVLRSARGGSSPSAEASPVAWLPALFARPYAELGADSEVTWAHLAATYRLGSGDERPAVVVTSAVALSGRTLPAARLAEATALAMVGDRLDREPFLAALGRAGYERVDLATEPGTVAVRGGVIDVYPVHLDGPIRLDCWGDDVERLTRFDPATQRSLHDVELVAFPPVHPFLPPAGDDEEAVEVRLRGLAGRCRVPTLRLASWLDEVKGGRMGPGAQAFAPAVAGSLRPLAELLPTDAVVISAAGSELAAAAEAWRESLHTEHAVAAERQRLICPPEEFAAEEAQPTLLGRCRDRVEVTRLAVGNEVGVDTWSLATTAVGDLHALLQRKEDPQHPFKPVALRLGAWARDGLAVHVVARGEAQHRRLKHLIGSYGQPVRAGEGWLFGPHGAGIHLWRGRLDRGFACPELGVVYVDETDIFGVQRRRAARADQTPEHLLRSFRELSEGDLVVHRDHGIGRFRELVRMRAGGVDGDFLELEYRDRAKLFLPVTRIGLLQRYVSGGREGYEPPLDKLGGVRWANARKKAKAAAEKIASELLNLYAARQSSAGVQFSPPDELYEEFEATFPFEETPDQTKAIAAVLDDLGKPTPMDRVVCGDVGYGKTEVALRAAFKAVEDGYQVAMLAPTTILVEQHYLTFAERMRSFGVKTAQLSRFVPPAEQREVLRRLREGDVDVVVGTHRLLQKDVHFQQLGLLVVDEEHRFGVKHKERIKKMRAGVDILTLSATPIPRTLHMSLLGIRDLSIIATPPQGRQAVETTVLRIGDAAVKAVIERELGRGGQVYYVTNRIQGMNRLGEQLEAMVPDARVVRAHGQMPPAELEDVMRRFIRGQVDVLLSTNIIESGIDVPNANTMLVHHAERFGLAQLYQLRGRIGRSDRKAFCAFLVPDPKLLSDDAQRRIGVLQQMSALGSGFALAVEDMELRGTGNLLGAEQHGQMDAIGYEAFMELIHETIIELKGAEAGGAVAGDAEITVDVPAFLPDDYLPDPHDRLVLYRRLTSAADEERLSELVDEVQDRYGQLPPPAADLVRMMHLRLLAQGLGLSLVQATRRRLKLGLAPWGDWPADAVAAFVQRAGGRWSLSPEPALERRIGEAEGTRLLDAVAESLRELQRFMQTRAGS